MDTGVPLVVWYSPKYDLSGVILTVTRIMNQERKLTIVPLGRRDQSELSLGCDTPLPPPRRCVQAMGLGIISNIECVIYLHAACAVMSNLFLALIQLDTHNHKTNAGIPFHRISCLQQVKGKRHERILLEAKVTPRCQQSFKRNCSKQSSIGSPNEIQL